MSLVTVNAKTESAWDRLSPGVEDAAFFAAWLETLISGMPGGSVIESVVVLGPANQGPFAPQAFWPVDKSCSPALGQACERALAMRLVVQVPGPLLIWAVPLIQGSDIHGVIGLRFNQATLPPVATQWLKWGEGWLLARRGMNDDQDAVVREHLMTMVDLVLLGLSGQGDLQAGQSVLTQMAEKLDAERVSLGFAPGEKHMKLWSMSHSPDFSSRVNLTRIIEACMDEACDQGEQISLAFDDPVPAGFSQGRLVKEHARLMTEAGSGQILTIPFVPLPGVKGCFTFEWRSSTDAQPHLSLASGLVPVLGHVLSQRKQQDRGLWRKFLDGWRHFIHAWFGPGHAMLKFSGLAFLGLVGLFSVWTAPFEVASKSNLEGLVRRQIVAPFDGYVAKAYKRAGEVVETGAILATLDDRDLQLEAARWGSQQQQYNSQLNDAQAQKNLAQMQINRAQALQAQAQRALSESMLQKTRVLAPFSGYIVSGDLSQQLGAAVRKGDLLFEIAPMDGYRVAIQVDESDIDHVRLGQTGRLMLTALPGQIFPIEVSLLTSVAEAKEGKNFFRIEAKLTQPVPDLRPGMEGIARIEVDERRVIWIWTRRLVDWVRLQVWSWTGVKL